MWNANLWMSAPLIEYHKVLQTTALDTDTAAKQAAIDAFRETLSDPFTLKEVDSWYEEIILPQRTVGRGNTDTSWLQREAWKWTLRAVAVSYKLWGLSQTNVPNPNGKCGDATLYVLQEYREYFPPDANGNRLTSEGFEAGGVVWCEGDSIDTFNDLVDLTHASVLMIDKAMIDSKLLYFMHDPGTDEYIGHNDNPTGVTFEQIKDWRVYDLWLTEKMQYLGDWWRMCQGWVKGTKTNIRLGLGVARW